jgi:hypothetical protein
MNDRNQETDEVQSQGRIAITYRGANVQADAEALSISLQTSQLAVEPVAEVGKDEAMLGAAEIIITIMLAPIAQAAAQAVIATALHHLRDYFVERVENANQDFNAQVVIKSPDSSKQKRYPFSLRQATAETIKAFFNNLEDTVLKV